MGDSVIEFSVNGNLVASRNPERSLLDFLRLELNLTTVKDGCSGQGVCGACLVEIDGQAALACATKLGKLAGKQVVTLDGFPENLRQVLALAFVNIGAVQCGFCTPGLILRTKILLATTPNPTRAEATRAVRPHLCRCTGYQPIVEAILEAAEVLAGQSESSLDSRPGVGASWPKHGGFERALGLRPFVDDLRAQHLPALAGGMLHGALVFSEYPRAIIKALHLENAVAAPGVVKIFTATDVPGRATTGMRLKDWPVYVPLGGQTRYIGDVLAMVVAESEVQARAAAALVCVDYQVIPPVCDPQASLLAPAIHPDLEKAGISGELPEGSPNVLLDKTIKRGPEGASLDFEIDDILQNCAHVVEAGFSVPAIEHAFLECEVCLAIPAIHEVPASLDVYDQGQGIWHDRDDIAAVLDLPPERVRVHLVDAGGGFGGREDITVQAHACLAAWLLKRPVKVRLSRPESLRMHPKRHAMRLRYTVGSDAKGALQAVKARILADAGAYASVSHSVVTRTGTHAAGAYHVPYVDVRVQAAYTNNIPAGAFRGFGVAQSNFAMESMLDLLAEKGGFDRWQLRYDNAVRPGALLTTGQRLAEGVALRETLLAVKPAYKTNKHVGLACAVKNSGIGNGVPEPSDCILTILELGGKTGIRIDHGWTEMGQGIHTVARQLLCQALNLDFRVPVEIVSSTAAGAFAGSTTASRGTFQFGRALLDATMDLRTNLAALGLRGERALESADLQPLQGRVFHGRYDSLGQTSAEGPPGEVRNHVSYSFATHLAILDDFGKLVKIVAAHDSGTVINPALYASQVTGGVVMGLGYAMSEELRQSEGRLLSDGLQKCGLLRATDVPEIEVIAIEVPDPAGPLGAKGLGEISAIPAAAALNNALAAFSGVRCFDLPHKKYGVRQGV